MLRCAPALRGALLDEPDGVAVAAGRLPILLSWYAVARAIETARAGSPRRTPIAAISVAFSACSVSSSTLRPDEVEQHGDVTPRQLPNRLGQLSPATLQRLDSCTSGSIETALACPGTRRGGRQRAGRSPRVPRCWRHRPTR